MKELLVDFPVIVEGTVRWGDMDALQHVHHTIFFRYFEWARISYFEKIGFQEIINKTGIVPVIQSIQCQFKLPLTYPDIIWIGAKITEICDDRFLMEHRIVSQHFQKIAAHGDAWLFTFNQKEKTKVSIPAELREGIEAVEKSISG